MSKNETTTREGFYRLRKVTENSVELTVAYGYTFNGEFVYGFNTFDGGGMIREEDITADTEVHPAKVVDVEMLDELFSIARKYQDLTDAKKYVSEGQHDTHIVDKNHYECSVHGDVSDTVTIFSVKDKSWTICTQCWFDSIVSQLGEVENVGK